MAAQPGGRADRDARPRSVGARTARACSRTPPSRGRPRDPAGTPDGPVASFVAAAGTLDVDRMESILDEAFAAQRFELAVETVVFPALARRRPGVGRGRARCRVPSMRRARRSDVDCRATSTRRGARSCRPGCWSGCHRQDTTSSARSRSPSHVGGLARASRISAVTCRWRAGCGWRATTAVSAIVVGAVTREDALAVDQVVSAIRTMDRPPVCFTGGPASLDVPVTSGAVQLPSSLDEARGRRRCRDGLRGPSNSPLTTAHGRSMLRSSRPAPALRKRFRAHHRPVPRHPQVTFPICPDPAPTSAISAHATADPDDAPPSVAAARP